MVISSGKSLPVKMHDGLPVQAMAIENVGCSMVAPIDDTGAVSADAIRNDFK